MATIRMYKTFNAMVLSQSYIRAPTGQPVYVLMDSSSDLGTNVTRADYLTGYPPQGATGIAHNEWFMYPIPFSGNTTIDGMVEGNVVVEIYCSGTSSDSVALTMVSVELEAHSASGIRSLTGGGKTIWGGSSSVIVTGTTSPRTVGVYFAFPVYEADISPNEYFVMRVKVYGYRTMTGTTGNYIRLLTSETDKDLILSIPLVEA